MTEEKYERAISKMREQIKGFKDITKQQIIIIEQLNAQKKPPQKIKKEC